MRLLSVLFLFLLCGSICTIAQDSSKQIKSEFFVSYKAKTVNGQVVKGVRGWYLFFLSDEYFEYDLEGDLIKTINWDDDGELDEISVYETNSNGELSRITDFIVNEKGDTVLDYMTNYYYDRNEFCYLDSSFNGDMSLNLYTVSAYDYDQKLSVGKTMYPDGNILLFHYEYFDDHNELIKTESYDENRKLESTTYYSRDTLGLYYAHCVMEGNDTTSYSYTNYNKEGFPINEINYYPDQVERYITYSFEYELNEFGDWVQKMIYREGKLAYVVERKIAYWN